MPFELSELGYEIVDNLADGPEPLSYLLREMRVTLLDRATIIGTLEELLELQIARFMNHHGQSLPSITKQDAWLELTDCGQMTWAIWRQTHRK